MKQRFLFGASALAIAIVAAGSAVAQESEVVESVFERERPDYTAEGHRVGAFDLGLGLDVRAMYLDNLYASNSNEKDDIALGFEPKVELNSDFNRHAVNFEAGADIIRVMDNTADDSEDYYYGVDGRLDVMRGTEITAKAKFEEETEERGSPDAANGKEPNEYTQTTFGLGFARDVARVGFEADLEFKDMDFDDMTTSTGTTINHDDRDREETEVSAKVSYEVQPGYDAFIKGSWNTREYDTATDDNGINRDSDGYEIAVGTDIELSGKTKASVYAGYMEQSYDSASLDDVSGASFGADLTWNVTPITSIIGGVDRSIAETTTNGASASLNTKFNLGVQHELRRNILLRADTSFTNSEYEGSATGVKEREDDKVEAKVAAQYLINKNYSVVGQYRFRDRDSNIAGQDYTSNRLMLLLKSKF